MSRSVNEMPFGVITSVTGDIAEVGMYKMSNDSKILWNGEVLNGPKIGAYLSIIQNDIRIIASVTTEKILDQQNTIRSKEFDNRYTKNSINRIINLKVKGIIEEGKFKVTSSYVPMIGNEVVLVSKNDLGIIYGSKNPINTIYVGKSLMEDQPVFLSINKIFASHIGIFGNTGSGKSNTLHKLFIELFRSEYRDGILKKSQFFVIDFNGEYVGKEMFSLGEEQKNIYKIGTSKVEPVKIPILKEYFYNADILSILFDARPATQVPFLRNAISKFKEIANGENNFHTMEIGLLERIIEKYNKVNGSALDNWIEAAQLCGLNDKLFTGLQSFFHKNDFGNLSLIDDNKNTLMDNGRITSDGYQLLQIKELSDELEKQFNEASDIRKLYYFLLFQRVFVTTWNKQNEQFIDPLFNRIKTGISSLETVIDLVDSLDGKYNSMNIFSLVNANLETRRLIPMLLSKMIYDEQKHGFSDKDVMKTKHLIIDEAHNILNSQIRNVGDNWQDYRLSVFEEIIKEGRKFGFYLTLSSQRPADISSTILSQTHNYIIHRLVNDNDLRMIENTMPTLDRVSYTMIPSLGKGEAVITGTALQVPLFTKIEKEETIRPNSDDIKLTEIWKK